MIMIWCENIVRKIGKLTMNGKEVSRPLLLISNSYAHFVPIFMIHILLNFAFLRGPKTVLGDFNDKVGKTSKFPRKFSKRIRSGIVCPD